MTVLLLLFGVSSLLLVGVGVLLWVRANSSDYRRDTIMRLRASGTGEAAIGPELAPRDARLSNPIVRAVCHWLWRAGFSQIEPEQVSTGLIVAAVVAPLILLIFGLFAGLTVLGLGSAAAYVTMSRRAAQRRAQIIGQLPEFLENVVRILSAGNTLEVAFSEAAHESPEPIRPLFISVGRQVRLGAAVDEVLVDAAQVHRIRDLRVIALAASINRRYGGSLRSVFRSLTQAIRSRDAAQRELKALTAETRFSALVLALIPMGLTLYILLQNPGYYASMWANPAGRVTLMFSVALQVTGIVVIWRMMRSTEDPAA